MNHRAVWMASKRHWETFGASKFKVEHEIYREDDAFDHPQPSVGLRHVQSRSPFWRD
jgi:hypothetical protein